MDNITISNTIQQKRINSRQRFPLWKQKLLRARDKWYMKNYPEATKDHGVPEAHKYSEKNTNELAKTILAWLKFNGHSAQMNSATNFRIERIELANNRFMKKATWSVNKECSQTHIATIVNDEHLQIFIGYKGECKKQTVQIIDGVLCYLAMDMQSFVEWYEQTFERNESLFDQESN